jgi:hypothetical protein
MRAGKHLVQISLPSFSCHPKSKWSNTMKNEMQTLLTFAMLGVAVLTHSVTFAGETITYKALVSRLTDLERLATPIDVGEKTSASTSHDCRFRYNEKTDQYENWSANGDGGGSIRREGSAQTFPSASSILAASGSYSPHRATAGGSSASRSMRSRIAANNLRVTATSADLTPISVQSL